jgi:hypothetical protein
MNTYTKEQCIEFLKEYKQFKKKAITRVKNPTTGRYLTSHDTIDSIKEKCKEQHQVVSQSSSSSSPTVNFNNITQLFKLPFDKNIINAYVPNTTYTDAIKILTKYIKTNLTDPNVIQYNNILKHIREIISGYNPLEWDKDSLDMFAMFNLTYTESYHLDREQQNANNHIKGVINRKPVEYFKDFVFNNNNIEERNISLKIILEIILEYNSHIPYITECIANANQILDLLLQNQIKKAFSSLSISFSKTPSPRSSSSDKKDQYIKYLLHTEPKVINEDDPISGDNWVDMDSTKLKHVIKVFSNTKTYAFYVKDLFKMWHNAVKTNDPNQPFANPYNREPFTEEQKTEIFEKMKLMYPSIKRPIFCKTRKDIKLIINHLPNDFAIEIQYTNGQLNIPLVNINIPMKHVHISDLRYFPPDIIDKIKALFNNNKILGKKIPFKLHKAFQTYNNKDLTNEATYKDFCNLLF